VCSSVRSTEHCTGLFVWGLQVCAHLVVGGGCVAEISGGGLSCCGLCVFVIKCLRGLCVFVIKCLRGLCVFVIKCLRGLWVFVIKCLRGLWVFVIKCLRGLWVFSVVVRLDSGSGCSAEKHMLQLNI